MFVCMSVCVGRGLGSWFMWICFGGLRAGFVGVSGWHQRQTARESGLYQRRLTPDGELQSGLEERRGRPGSLAEQRAENWKERVALTARLIDDAWLLTDMLYKVFSGALMPLKSPILTHTHTHARTNRQTVWSGVSELSPGWRIRLREVNTPLFLRRLIISAEKQRQNTTWSECMHSKWTKSEISPCSTSTNPFAQSSVVSWKGVRTITILKRLA